ncbi:hypothetical protein AUCHE_16_02130 [Austwickia chelonae NBRC 105200]|uniref:CobQ/CobB/MinD/ParA nucleotide binding domain-containing protein n=1 Tax=Austwickia chelonae NBRC 105200 TaxID=1184607 RepID=K6V975_9MICO|nr:hypothetical protein AUCHE_16_02130 [Austwickia chelonae NBRC 105200]
MLRVGQGSIPSRREDTVETPPEAHPPTPRAAPVSPPIPRRSPTPAREEDQRWAVPAHLLDEEPTPQDEPPPPPEPPHQVRTAEPAPSLFFPSPPPYPPVEPRVASETQDVHRGDLTTGDELATPESPVVPEPPATPETRFPPEPPVIPATDQPTTPYLDLTPLNRAPAPLDDLPPAEPTLFLVKEDITEPRLRRHRNTRRRRVSAPLQPWADATPDDLALANRAVQRPMSTGRRIAVVSAAGGCGATSISVALGAIMSELRADRIALVGASPDRGSMSRRLGEAHAVHLEELLSQEDSVQLGQAGVDLLGVAARFAAVLPPAESMVPAVAGDLVESLSRTRAVTVVDLGCARPDSGAAMILRDVHAAAVVTAPSLDGVESCRATLDRLRRGGVSTLRIRAVVVETGRRTGMSAETAAQQLSDTGVPVLTSPEDPHLATGGPIDIGMLSESTQMALTVLAASLLDASDGRFESFVSEG